ncbi:MAG: hypothetical protein HY762_07510, partial [Planctomycetes bacterium]|nr:hypothetical protein [Planctomycetota bacterium]
EANPALFPGIYVAENIRRLYPNGHCAAHILGYVTPIWKEEYPKLKEDGFFKEALSPEVENGIYEILLTRGDFKDDYIGRMGVEKKYDGILRGRSGIKLIDYDYYSKQKHELSRIGSMAGQDISLTIDTALQLKMDQLMKNITGAAVVIDVTNGEILALACSPTFDPNIMQPPVSPETLQYINNKTIKPLYNRAISGQYAIGSVFKMMTAVAALEEGRITENSTFYCNGYFSKTSMHFKCWVADYQREHGNMALNDGIKNSCNVYFFNIGKLAGAEAILKWAAEFGFGERTGIDLPAEARGLLPDPSRGVSDGRVWTPSDTLNISIGQGDLMVTPIQVVRMMAAISNGGYLVTPHIVRNGATEPPRKINVSKRTLNAVRQGLYSVVQAEGGTAHGSGLAKFPVAGKTSTAELGAGKKSHAWFAGFAPHQKPKYAFVVMAENAGKGSEIAAPIAAGFMPEIMACLTAVAPVKEGVLMKTGTQPAQRKPAPEEEEDEGPTDD